MNLLSEGMGVFSGLDITSQMNVKFRDNNIYRDNLRFHLSSQKCTYRPLSVALYSLLSTPSAVWVAGRPLLIEKPKPIVQWS